MRTRLIVISGSPGSGKTTLADRLKQELAVPLISKDLFKDVLMNVALPADRAASRQIGAFAWSVLYAALDAMIGLVPAVIIEANFQRGHAEAELLRRAEQCAGILISCVADREIVLQRIHARAGDPTRHAGHFDQDAIPDLLRLLDEDAYRLAGLGLPTLEVDTTAGYNPALRNILQTAKDLCAR